MIATRTFHADGWMEIKFSGKAIEELKKMGGPYTSMFNDDIRHWAIKDRQLYINPNGADFEHYKIKSITKKEMHLVSFYDVLKSDITYKRRSQ